MPRYATADIAHAAATDHHIARLAAPPAKPGPPRPLVPFYRDRLDPHNPEQERDLGITLIQAAFQGRRDMLLYPVSSLALLEQAVQNDPDDLDAWEAKAGALLLQKRVKEALAEFEAILAHSPRRERSLVQAAHLAHQLQIAESARRYWQRAVDVNPWMPSYRKILALILAEQQEWRDCGPQCEAWLRLDPASTEARTLWIRCLASTGHLDEARRELERLEPLRPPSLAGLRLWLAEQEARPRSGGSGGTKR
jgi:tetratricopeptide (TPR) repeat protein